MIPEPDSDQSPRLVRDAILGGREALGDLLLAYTPLFKAHINLYLAKRRLPPHQAEDLLQDVYEEACRAFSYYDPTARDGHIGGLMQAIVKSTCLNKGASDMEWLQIPLSAIFDMDDDEETDYLVTDQQTVAAWAAENSPGYIEDALPLEKRRGRGPGKHTKPKEKKVRGRRLSKEELQRRDLARLEWAQANS